MAKHVIVNGDDYGLTTAVSKGIRQAHLEGILTSTTVMPTGMSVREDLPLLLKECPEIGLGVHLTLTRLRPVCKSHLIKSLIQNNGSFYSLKDYQSKKIVINEFELYTEWKSQIEFILSFGVEIDHLDSHHHSSYFNLNTLDVTLKLCEEYKLPTRTPFSIIEEPIHLKTAYKLLSLKKIKYPDKIFAQLTDNRGAEETLIKILNSVQDGTSEIVTHPGNYDNDLKSISSYVEGRQNEILSLTSAPVQLAVKQNNIQLSTYKTAFNVILE